MEREKPQWYQRPYYPHNQPNKPKASLRKNDGKVPFKKFVNAPWEANMKQKEIQKDMNVVLNTIYIIILNKITSYYFHIYEMPHNPEYYYIYLN